MAWEENEAERRQFILDGQQHADFYLMPLANPAGKTVLVLGAGAGTDCLWALRQGAREVVGLDVLEQDVAALRAAASQCGLDPGRVSFHRMSLAEAPRLGRRFDLVLSNNVFEHVADLPGAFAACAQAVEPDHGRVAIFSAPLFYASSGSHLPTEPWEHLWGDPEELRARLLASGRLRPGHALEDLSLAEYMDREICLNRARLADSLDAIRRSGLTFLHLSVLPDRCLAQLPHRLEAIRRRSPVALDVADLAVEGYAVELVLPAEGSPAACEPVAAQRLADERSRHGADLAAAEARIEAGKDEAAGLRRQIAELQEGLGTLEALIARVEASWSFRLGRALTAPGRWLRSRSRAGDG